MVEMTLNEHKKKKRKEKKRQKRFWCVFSFLTLYVFTLCLVFDVLTKQFSLPSKKKFVRFSELVHFIKNPFFPPSRLCSLYHLSSETMGATTAEGVLVDNTPSRAVAISARSVSMVAAQFFTSPSSMSDSLKPL